MVRLVVRIGHAARPVCLGGRDQVLLPPLDPHRRRRRRRPSRQHWAAPLQTPAVLPHRLLQQERHQSELAGRRQCPHVASSLAMVGER